MQTTSLWKHLLLMEYIVNNTIRLIFSRQIFEKFTIIAIETFL